MVRSDESFASVIRVNIALLRFSGVLTYETNARAKSAGQTINSQNVLGALAYGCLFAYSILHIREFVLRAVYLDTWMESFAMILSFVGGQARFTLLLLFRDRFRRLLAICERLWSTSSATEKRCIRDYVRATRRLTYYYLFGCAFAIFFYAVASLFMGRSDDSANVTTTRTLPYACPVEVHSTPYYEIMYAAQLCSMINVGLTCVGADTIGPMLILTVCGHFKALNSRILSAHERDRVFAERICSTSAQPSLEITREQDDELRSCAKLDLEARVRYHQTVLEFCEEVEKLTTGIFLTQLLGSTYNISLVGFKLAGIDPDKFKYATQVSIAVIQLYLCNWPADVLLAEMVSTAASFFTTISSMN